MTQYACVQEKKYSQTFYHFIIQIHLSFYHSNSFHLPFLKFGLLFGHWQATISSPGVGKNMLPTTCNFNIL